MNKKDIKINIKNKQLAKALDLSGVKDKLEKKKASKEVKKRPAVKKTQAKAKAKTPPAETKETEEAAIEEKPQRRVRARSKSAFAEKEEEAPAVTAPQPKAAPPPEKKEQKEETAVRTYIPEHKEEVSAEKKSEQKLGPTGKHIKDLLPTKKKKEEVKPKKEGAPKGKKDGPVDLSNVQIGRESFSPKKKNKSIRFKEYRDVKPTRHQPAGRFDARDRQGLRQGEDEFKHRRRRKSHKEAKTSDEDYTVRPNELKIRVPITLKDLAAAMKLKASELIGKLFANGVIMTINDALDDDTTIQLLGEEFGCAIEIDTTEEERIRITSESIAEEISSATEDALVSRAPVVAFMGHVDHGKTSLIDKIRESNITAGEAGDITQHIGAFKCSTDVGDITILDTPGHEAFSAMRARGANVTDIVVLVIAGDEGIRQQTIEAIEHAREANVTIIVALNKCDKPNFNADNVYRQLSEHELLPEAWGGQIVTINCSATTGEGVKQLLEMLALQAEVLELKANPANRARGRVIESQMHKGLGATATVLVQNGTLKLGDSVVFDERWARIKTMHDDQGHTVEAATPSTPVRITGLSGVPGAGQEFVVVADEKEARNIAEVRQQDKRKHDLQQRKARSLEKFLDEGEKEEEKKTLYLILRADVQGSVEALRDALEKIYSKKIAVEIVHTGVGEITESDIQLAAASKAAIVGFHTQLESHAEPTLKETGVKLLLHDIIYHAIDDVKALMVETLDKIPQEVEKGKAEVRAIFKSSQHGVIAGCLATEGTINRNHKMRVRRGDSITWTGNIASLRRVKEDVREVQSGVECGILLAGFSEFEEGDILEAFEIIYITQEL